MTAQTRRTWLIEPSVTTNTWTVEIAPHKGAYVVVCTEDWFSDAWSAYRDLEVSDGARKVLKRNGNTVMRTTSTRSIAPSSTNNDKPVYQQELLPIAL